MPTYGRLPFLHRAVASFLSQTYDNKELVIVNDDKNVIVACDEKNVTCINLNKKILVAQKRNLATQLGYYDLIMPHDDDDVFLPNRIANNVQIHKANPELELYRNKVCYTIYGDSFTLDVSPDNACSYKKTAWFKVNGYTHTTNLLEDREFNNKIDNKIEEENYNVVDFVYNFGGVNYHLSSSNHDHIDGIASAQLRKEKLINGKFYIEPDFDGYNKFIQLEELYKQTNAPVKVIHKDLAKIDIA